MKPHPRIRKTIKWGGAAVTVLLVVVWIASFWWGVAWHDLRLGSAMVSKGGLVLTCFSGMQADWPYEGWMVGEQPQIAIETWWFNVFRGNGPNGTTSLFLPLWVFAIGSAAASLSALYLDTLVCRRAKLNLCPKCGYDRTGILKDAKCPECGAAPTISSPPSSV